MKNGGDGRKVFKGQIPKGILGIYFEKEDEKLFLFKNNMILQVDYPIEIHTKSARVHDQT